MKRKRQPAQPKQPKADEIVTLVERWDAEGNWQYEIDGTVIAKGQRPEGSPFIAVPRALAAAPDDA